MKQKIRRLIFKYRIAIADWLVGADLRNLRLDIKELSERMDNFPSEVRNPTAEIWNAITDSNRQMNRIEYKLKQFNKRIEKLEGLEKYPNPPISSMFGQDPE